MRKYPLAIEEIPRIVSSLADMRDWELFAVVVGIPFKLFEWEQTPLSERKKQLLTGRIYTDSTSRGLGEWCEMARGFYDFYDPEDRQSVNRGFWQVKQLDRFMESLFRRAPDILRAQPVKIPSGKYEEKVKPEYTQHDLIERMAKKLLDLPKYQAYVKTVAGKTTETHHIKTLPLPAQRDKRVENRKANIQDGYLRKRSEIDAEIYKRNTSMPPGRQGTPTAKRKPPPRPWA